MSFLPLTDNYLLPATGIAVLIILAIVVVFWIHRRRSSPARNPAAGLHGSQKFAYQPESKPVLHLPAVRKSTPVRKVQPQPPVAKTDLVSGKKDLADSLVALAETYSLDSFTLASYDGLVIASTDRNTAQADAAQYAEIFASSHLYETPGAVLFGLAHKGSDLIGIIRVNRDISDEICQNIENDTKDILNSWI